PNAGASTIDFMNAIYTIMQSNLEGYNLWQLDGRPMSGDIGRGATRETVSFAVDLTSVPDRPLGLLSAGWWHQLIHCRLLKESWSFQG
uniref:Iron-sulphur binding protein LdpA C-terminal domain-containing protein n=1 Tax=Aegilops tauschii subsp. strangulata TaxID=200361 RepID=A0A452Y2R3_AEGTS